MQGELLRPNDCPFVTVHTALIVNTRIRSKVVLWLYHAQSGSLHYPINPTSKLIIEHSGKLLTFLEESKSKLRAVAKIPVLAIPVPL